MARQKGKIKFSVKSHDDAAEAMSKLAGYKRKIVAYENEMNDKLDEIKDSYAEKIKVEQKDYDEVLVKLQAFCEFNRSDFDDVRHRKTLFGEYGFRKSNEVKTKTKFKVADVIAALKKRGHHQCVKITENWLKDEIKKLPTKEVDVVGARIVKKDEFWCEVKTEETAQI